MKQLWTNVAEVGSAKIFSLIVSLGVLFLIARVLGPEPQGIIAASMGWVTLFANLAGLSLGQVAHYRIQLRTMQDWFPGICCGLCAMFLILSTLACLAAISLYHLTEGRIFRNITPTVLVLSFSLLPLTIVENYLSNLLAALDRLKWYNLAQYVGRGIWLVMTAVFLLLLDMHVSGAIIAQVIGQTAVVAIGATALLKGHVTRLRFDFSETTELLKGAARLHFNTVSSFILAHSTVLFLNNYCSTTEVAWYQMANQMMMTILLLPQAASIVFFSNIAQVGPHHAWPKQKKMIIHVLCLTVLISFVAFFVAPFVIPILAGNAFLPVVKIFRALLPSLIGLSLAQLMTAQWISRGAFMTTTVVTTAAAFITIALNHLWIPRYGVMGAVWVSLLTYVGFTFIVQVVFACWCDICSRRLSLAAPTDH
jgi:enterobacterial common antigen flippase